MTEKLREFGCSSTQNNGCTARMTWVEPLSQKEAGFLVELFELALQRLKRIAAGDEEYH